MTNFLKENDMKKILAVLALFPLVAIAQAPGGPVSVNGKNVSITAEDTGTVALQTIGDDDVKFNTNSVPRWRVDGPTGNLLPEATPANIGSSTYEVGNIYTQKGSGIVAPVAIITPVTAHPTPGKGGDVSVGTVNRLVAGSPTLAYVQVPVATANVGKSLTVVNEGSNPVLIAAQGTDTMQAAAANTPYSCATTKLCDCVANSTSTWRCGSK